MGKKIFVSYRADEEGNKYKNMLVAWSKNDNGYFDVKFEDTSIGVSINSNNADYIKKRIQEKIIESETVLVLIGEHTHKSDWVEWEIEKSADLNKKLVAIKLDNSYVSPKAILKKNASWARTFRYESIKKAIDG